jgi:shikimate kinase
MSVADSRPLFLVGFMGSGKTTVGRLLAARLGWPFHDTDALVEARDGRAVARIFEESGEARFRELEQDVLAALGGAPAVVATGGGLFQSARARRWLWRHGRTVWLDVPLAVAIARVGVGVGRPMWLAGDRLALRALFEKRRAAYALARRRVDGSDPRPARVVELVMALFR